MEDFMVTCAPVPLLKRGSSRMYHTSDPVDVYPALAGYVALHLWIGLPPDPASRRRLPLKVRDLRLALLLTLGSANTWCEDFHLTSYVPCLAHTRRLSGAVHRVRFEPDVKQIH